MTTIHEPTILLKPIRIDLHETCRIDSFVKIEGGQGVTIGDRVHISSFCHVNMGGGTVIIKDLASLASHVVIGGGTATEKGLTFSAAADSVLQHVVRSTTTIGVNAFVAAHATVLPGVTVGDGAIIAAGAVVTKDVPPFEVWGGVPAKFMRKRATSDNANQA